MMQIQKPLASIQIAQNLIEKFSIMI